MAGYSNFYVVYTKHFAFNSNTKDFIIAFLTTGKAEYNVPNWGSDVLDSIIFLDIKQNSPTYGQHGTLPLISEGNVVFIPYGYAVGFCC